MLVLFIGIVGLAIGAVHFASASANAEVNSSSTTNGMVLLVIGSMLLICVALGSLRAMTRM